MSFAGGRENSVGMVFVLIFVLGVNNNKCTYASLKMGFFFFFFSAMGRPSSSTIKSSASDSYSPSDASSSK